MAENQRLGSRTPAGSREQEDGRPEPAGAGDAEQAKRRMLKLGKALSPFEMEIAALAKAGYGRNGIAAALGISPGTVKVVLRQIRWKLGEGWRDNPSFAWPSQASGPAKHEQASTLEGAVSAAEAAATQAAPAATAAESELAEGVGCWEREAREGRRLAALLLVQSAPRRTILKVSGGQRFFLKPLLSALEAEGHLRLLAADRSEVFDPPWLPIVNRGRKAVRAANYLVRNEARVKDALQEYFSAGLAGYLRGLLERLATARSLAGYWRRVNLPGPQEMWELVYETFCLNGER